MQGLWGSEDHWAAGQELQWILDLDCKESLLQNNATVSDQLK